MVRIIVEYFFNPNSTECKNYMKIVVNPLIREQMKEVEWRIINIYDPKEKKKIEEYKINAVPALVINESRILIGFKPQKEVKSIIQEEIEKEKEKRQVKLG
nr:thioredoxin family protein [Candidatus Freyarchaeota archaeon]